MITKNTEPKTIRPHRNESQTYKTANEKSNMRRSSVGVPKSNINELTAVEPSLQNLSTKYLETPFEKKFKNIPDFNVEKYNRISSSPISTPKLFTSKLNLLDETDIFLTTGDGRLSLYNPQNTDINDEFSLIEKRNYLTEDKTRIDEIDVSEEKENITKFHNKISDFKKKINFTATDIKESGTKPLPMTQRNINELRKTMNFGTTDIRKKLSNNLPLTSSSDRQEKRHLTNAKITNNVKKQKK